MTSKYKAVIFDLFGTLTNGQANPEARIFKQFDLESQAKAWDLALLYDRDTNVDLSDGTYERRLENAVCATQHNDLQEYYGKVLDAIKRPNTPKNRETIENLMTEDLKGEIVREGAVDLLKKIESKGVKLALISDLPNSRYDIPATNRFDEYFSLRVLSYQTGKLKYGGEPFDIVLGMLGLRAPEVIMVGNSFKADVEPARKKGIRALHFVPKYERLEEDQINKLDQVLDYL